MSVTYLATDNLPLKAKPVLQLVVVEKQVGANEYVVRKMLPSAVGTMLPTPVLTNQTDTYTMNWQISNPNIDVSQLAIVAFIQDLETQKVYQTKINLNPTDLPTLITGVEQPLIEQIKFFPNPANQSVTIQLPKSISESTPVKMFDVNGHEVYNTVFEKGYIKKVISTSDLASGVYLIAIESDKGITRKKVLVVH
jgi:hypothetical protein